MNFKKMNQAFDDMPLRINGITYMMDIYQQSNPDEPHQVAAKHAAHAINHVDVLADALEFLLGLPRGCSGRIIIEKSEETVATAALKAYRGQS